ncbi:phage scaffolding protein [Psychrobacillus sp. FJAT-21963]|uniref:phage scaffolding protein n=1 Tax=Psychrobacillus sp. FJAT-21963 TaxID=1712028 RepID=UPI0007007AD0|nr:phage scaffolding protein [Psychrobacillus sp. FJAT-21963]KQL37135.1 chemotaxis protein [Psychrobacillus sp. FJAT-21963]
MNRAFLEALGLDKDTVDKIMGEHGKSVETNKTKLKDLTTERDDLKGQLAQRDTDLDDLKKKAKGSEDLQTQLADLQTKYDTEKGEYETKLKETQLSSAIKLSLAGKVHDTDIAISQIDKSKIELGEDGNVAKGLDEQLKTLQESKPFLFVPETKGTNISGVIPATPKGKQDPPAENYGKKIAEERSQGTEGLESARKTYFE